MFKKFIIAAFAAFAMYTTPATADHGSSPHAGDVVALKSFFCMEFQPLLDILTELKNDNPDGAAALAEGYVHAQTCGFVSGGGEIPVLLLSAETAPIALPNGDVVRIWLITAGEQVAWAAFKELFPDLPENGA